jgi:hypothetical protein
MLFQMEFSPALIIGPIAAYRPLVHIPCAVIENVMFPLPASADENEIVPSM